MEKRKIEKKINDRNFRRFFFIENKGRISEYQKGERGDLHQRQ